MTLPFNKPFLDLDGNPVDGDTKTLGQSFAKFLINQASGDVIKMWEWALALNKNEPLSVDNADKEFLKNFILTSQSMSIAFKKQLLDCFNVA